MILDHFPDQGTFIQMAETANVIPVCTQILADMETPVSILQKFYKKTERSFLLESVEGGERWARYSFLGVRTFGTIKIFSKTVELKTRLETRDIPHHNDPLEVIRKICLSFIPADIPKLPRFWSGITGYFTYEMISFFEDLAVSLPEGTPYAEFIIPEEMIIFDNIKQSLTCLKICYLNKKDNPQSEYENSRICLDKMLEKISSPRAEKFGTPGKKIELVPEISEDQYLSRVDQIKDHIIKGDIFQAVYSLPFSCQSDIDPVRIYRAQRYINPSPYMFFMNFDDLAIAGSSPETMVRLENDIAELRPIAGTRPRGKTEQEDRMLADELLNDEKEKAEHVMLIDLGRNDLGRIAKAGTVQVTDTMFIERYSHVMHLVSNISCDMKQGSDAFDLFRATFPAGTLSGAPKIRAMEIISAMEDHPRRLYGGAAGYISFTGNMDFAITIRTAVMEKDKFTVQAGAGIVFDSDPKTEYKECQNKAESVEAALKLSLSNHYGGR